MAPPPPRLVRIGHLVAAGAWAVLTLALALELCLWIDCAGTDALAASGPAAAVDRAALHHAIIATVRSGAEAPGALDMSERIHLHDVHRLVVLARLLGVIALLGVAATWPLAGRRGLRDGGLVLLGAGLGLGLVALDWPVFFRALHPLLFGAGQWDFDPGRHLLAALYSPGYFARRLLPAVVPVAALGLAAWRLGRGEERAPAWRRRQRHDAWWALAGVPALALGLAAGLHFAVPWSWAHLTWSALLVTAVVAGASVVRCRGTLPGLVALVVVACGVLGIAVGLRVSDLRARSATAAAAAAIAVIDEHRAAGRRFAGLAALPREVHARLPDPPAGSGPWYYVPIRGGYLLGFRGPLAWHYEYHSRRGTWNLPHYGP